MGLDKRRIQVVKNALLKRPYIFYFIIIFLVYVGLNIFINESLDTFSILSSFNKNFLVPFLIFNFLFIPFLIGLNINLAIMKFKEVSQMASKGASGFGFVGIFGGVLGGACPGCFAGLFPALLGLFGITVTLSIFPLNGLEISIASVILLIVGTVLLSRETVCLIPTKK